MTQKSQSAEPESGVRDTQALEKHAVVGRIFYVKPELYCHGDIRTLTMGGSPGMGESGGFMTVQHM